MPDLGPLVDVAAPLGAAAIKGLLRTTAGAVVLTIVTAGACFAIAYDGSILRGLLAVAIVVVLGVVVGTVLSLKTAVVGAIRVAVERLALGRRLAGRVFARLEGTAVAAHAERIPLAQAEQKLRAAIGGVQREDLAGQTWAVRKVGEKVLGAIETVTLARFREEGQATGGISVARTGAVVGETIDGFVLDTLAKKVTALTALAAGGALLLCIAAAFVIRQIR